MPAIWVSISPLGDRVISGTNNFRQFNYLGVIAPLLFLFISMFFLLEENPSHAFSEKVVSPNPSNAPVDVNTYFSETEMAKWKRYRTQKIKFHFISMGSVVLFYFILFFLGVNRFIKKISVGVAQWCYTNPTFIKIGACQPLLQKIMKIPEKLFGGKQWLEVLTYCLFFLFLLRLFFFPYAFYRSYVYELQHGLSNYTLGLWFLDYVKSLWVTTPVLSLMVFGIYGLLTRIGSRWWLFLWAGVSIAIFGYVYIAPYRDLIYSEFRSLAPGELRARLERLATDQEVNLEDILVVDASRRTKKVNAYVKGSGPSKRMILTDTLLEQFTPREITMIVAHELSHWKEPHKKLPYLIFSITVFFILFLANRILEWGTRFRVFHYSSPTDVAGLPMLFLTFFIIFQIIRPVNLYWKRNHELETDRQSIEMVCDPEAFIQVHVKLARLNYTDVRPHPLTVLLFASHPPFSERIRTAQMTDCRPEIQKQDLPVNN